MYVLPRDAGDGQHGMWIDTATFEHICADRATQAAVLAQRSPTPRPSAGEILTARAA